MRQDRMRQSSNIEDRRGMGPARSMGGGRMVAGGGGLGVIVLILYIILGGNPGNLVAPGPTTQVGSGVSSPLTPAGERAKEFVAAVLGDTEDVWNEQFRALGRRYEPPTLVLFTGSVESGCGFASAAVGPFYCPADGKIYVDLTFFEELSDRFGAPGDFAQAYVLAHEVGHHVQNLLGVTDEVDRMRGRLSEADFNALSVKLELQADFYAGVWAHHAQAARQILDKGDIEEGLRAAAAVGDDRLQMQAKGYVVPDSFTHGTSEQRARWFRKGFETGDVRQGDTFAGR